MVVVVVVVARKEGVDGCGIVKERFFWSEGVCSIELRCRMIKSIYFCDTCDLGDRYLV